jgi:hypothetical protein
VTRFTPKKGRLYLKVPGGKHQIKGTPVFLIDRKETYLETKMAALEREMDTILKRPVKHKERVPKFQLRLSRAASGKNRPFEMHVFRQAGGKKTGGQTGIWLSGTAISKMNRRASDSTWAQVTAPGGGCRR